MKASLIATLTALVLVTSLGRGQVSTFPEPPHLAPPAEGSTDPATKSAPALNLDPSASDPAQALGKSSTPAAGGTNAAPVVPVTAASLSSMSALDDKVALAAGDTISFRVIEDRDDPVTRIVTDTGEIDFPLIGRVKVAGRTCHDVALEVKKQLEVDYYKHATVIVGLDLIAGQDKSKPRDFVWVVGQVKEVGPQELSKAQTSTVSQIILRAGGFGDFADQRKVKLIHRGGSSASAPSSDDLSKFKDADMIDVKAVFDGKSSADPVVKPGDYIIVPKKWVNLY
jgi:protein involved in polysaccharide export with SLBB domain